MNRRDSQKTRIAVADVQAVYAELEQRPILRNCVRLKECCHFKLTGRTPYLTKGEALLAAKALRATPHLYFAGELLDIDGITGGFNFQSAWTTGWIAGRAMADV